MHRKWNKFFNRMKKSHLDYGPKSYFEPTQGETDAPANVLFMTYVEAKEFGVGAKGHDEFVFRISAVISDLSIDRNMTAGELSTKLNQMGIRTKAGGRWTNRLVAVFALKFMSRHVHY